VISLQAAKSHRNERIAVNVLRVAAIFVIFAITLLIVYLTYEGTKSFYVDKLSIWTFLFSSNYDPQNNFGGSAVFIVGTLLVTVFAIVVGGPFGIAVGVFLSEIAPPRMAQILKPAIELLVGIPSVVYGWLGLTLLVPFLRTHTSSPSGFGLAAAGIVLSIMILPTVISLSEDAFRSLPLALREGSMALGSTRWQMITQVLLPSASSGLTVALILGIARAVGETLAVQMVIGNSSQFPKGIFSPTASLTTEIVIDMGGAPQGSFQEHLLFSMAFFLLLIAMALILIVRFALRRRA
jgi:phosphate transport system permease protein